MHIQYTDIVGGMRGGLRVFTNYSGVGLRDGLQPIWKTWFATGEKDNDSQHTQIDRCFGTSQNRTGCLWSKSCFGIDTRLRSCVFLGLRQIRIIGQANRDRLTRLFDVICSVRIESDKYLGWRETFALFGRGWFCLLCWKQ